MNKAIVIGATIMILSIIYMAIVATGYFDQFDEEKTTKCYDKFGAEINNITCTQIVNKYREPIPPLGLMCVLGLILLLAGIAKEQGLFKE